MFYMPVANKKNKPDSLAFLFFCLKRIDIAIYNRQNEMRAV